MRKWGELNKLGDIIKNINFTIATIKKLSSVGCTSMFFNKLKSDNISWALVTNVGLYLVRLIKLKPLVL